MLFKYFLKIVLLWKTLILNLKLTWSFLDFCCNERKFLKIYKDPPLFSQGTKFGFWKGLSRLSYSISNWAHPFFNFFLDYWNCLNISFCLKNWKQWSDLNHFLKFIFLLIFVISFSSLRTLSDHFITMFEIYSYFEEFELGSGKLVSSVHSKKQGKLFVRKRWSALLPALIN